MTEPYNPIVRTFGQYRSVLVDRLGMPRSDIRPGTPLATLLPVPKRRDVWRDLQRHGLRLPDLTLSERDRRRMVLRVLRAAVSSAVSLQSGPHCSWPSPWGWACIGRVAAGPCISPSA